MEKLSIVDQLLTRIDNIHELGRQRAFELGNPFYAKYEGNGDYYTKELPSGERYLVKVEIVTDQDEFPIEIKDTIIKRIVS
ncbi:hypothetical protein ACEN9X_16950 [Mucilaginibacter sp. Mucisp86]|uniref:hypothetical protein n=1 Tax=Mucilaginibacter sp. Mucisp86 TaxID=3243060 RepID=UPI0039B44DBA